MLELSFIPKLALTIENVIFFATLIAFEVDDINRFGDYKKFHGYMGLIPSTYSSGNRTFHSRLTKQGNKYLRWAFVEAVWPAIRCNYELKKYYQRIKIREGANIATARRLATIAYRILKESRDYRLH